jgi:hypothetical protein
VPVVPTALVTGPFERVADMTLALKSAGFEVLAAEADLGHIPGGLGEVDCYLQLPPDAPPGSEDACARARATVAHPLLARFARARATVADPLLARFDAAAQVAPMLAPMARVVLVADPADGRPAPDMRLVRILVEAIIADYGGDDVRVAVVDGARPPEEIIAFARSEPPSPTALPTTAGCGTGPGRTTSSRTPTTSSTRSTPYSRTNPRSGGP